MSRSRSAGPRVPSPWWVLLPGLLLALAGARAVTSEAERARDEARDSARMAAARVARAFGTLVDEYVAPLPGSGDTIAADDIPDVTRHLVRPFAVRADGAWIDTREIPSIAIDVQERDTAIAADVLTVVASDESGPAAGAALLAGAAETLETPGVAAGLLVRAAALDLAAGDPMTALGDLRRALSDLPATDSQPAELAPFIDACAALPNVVRRAYENGDCDLLWSAEVLVWARRAGLPAALTEQVLGAPPRADAEGDVVFETVRRRAMPGIEHVAIARAFAEQPGSGVGLTRAQAVLVGRRTRVERGVATVSATVGGQIPDTTLGERVGAEIASVLADVGAAAVLRAPDGTAYVPGDEETRPQSGSDRIVAVAEVGGRARGWSAEASVSRPTGLPTSALLLAAAVLAAILGLGVGAVTMSRAARHHARLAEERRSFLDHVAHEVRTPAASLLALSEELQRGHVQGERVGLYHDHLARESRRLADLVEETLDLARLEGGRLVAKREPLDLRDVVLEAVDSARADEGRVDVELPDDEVPVRADRSALRRALRNLVDNALKHGAAEQPVEVVVVARGGEATVTVRDHGRGIPPEHVTRVFERFHRVPSDTHEVKGVGLGLALVREVAAAHDGSVHTENADGGGARFTLRLPTTDAPRDGGSA